MNLRRWGLVPAVVLGVGLAACSNGKTTPTVAGSGDTSSASPIAGPLTIHILDFAFGPKAPTVKVGTKVTWVNDDSAVHTATASTPKGIFDTKGLDKGASADFTFTTAGTFSYVCSIHQYMTGTVTVVP